METITIEQKEELLKEQLEKEFPNDVYTTEEATDKFEFIGFVAPYVSVREKSTGIKGSLQFTDMPRLYFKFMS